MSDPHLDPNDPDALAAATQILDQHELLQHEDNIRSAVKRFIEVTGLAAADELELESSPGEGAKRIDLKTPDLLIEFKKRIGSKPGLDPDPEHVEQLDGYLETSQATGQPQRLGVLTDGKYWLLRWPGAGPVRTQKPYAFTFSSAAQWFALFEWPTRRIAGLRAPRHQSHRRKRPFPTRPGRE